MALTDDKFLELARSSPKPFLAVVTVDGADCPPCVKADAITSKVASKYSGRIVVGKLASESLDTVLRDHWMVTNLYSLHTMPSYLLFRDGAEVWRSEQLTEFEEIERAVESVLPAQ